MKDIFVIVCLLKINAEMLLNWPRLFKHWMLLSLKDPDHQGGSRSQFGLNTRGAWAPGPSPGSANSCYYDAMYYSILGFSSFLTNSHDNRKSRYLWSIFGRKMNV